MFSKFWKWYDRHTTLNTGIAAGLFSIQLVHLYWLTTAVVLFKLFGRSFFQPSPWFETVMAFVDYTEIPAIITTSLIYINEIRKKFNYKSLWFLIFLNSQWLHMFWITDEFVVEKFTTVSIVQFPTWLAWIAIFIDYLEIPVIIDTLRRFFASYKTEGIGKALQQLKED